MSQVYMTAKLNLADDTILYPQVSLDNIVASISDPTLVSVATTTNGKVPVAQLPTTLTVTESNTTVPTAGAVYSALGTKQNTLVEGDNIIHIIGGSTIMADITNLDVAGIDQTATNGVHLVLDGNTVSAAAELVTSETAGVLAGVSDGIALDNGVISADVGSGLKIGADTYAGKVVIDEASVESTLQDVRIDGASTVTPVDDQVVTPGNLRGALSVGQAVDVSCAPYNNSGSIVYVNDDFLQGFTATMVNGTTVGFYDTTTHRFPKFADGLVYLLIANVSGSGTVTPNGASAVSLSGTPQRVWTKVTASGSGYISASANATMTVTNWRQYEVTALTDEAIAYIAQLPDPDAFFRTASVYSLRDKYLVKQDMVCPFIPTIGMPDNSDLTVAAGLSYKIRYTNDNPHIITADTIPADGYGWDTHVQMFIKGTSSIIFQQPLILMDTLTPNAGHNLSIKWRNGDALVYVEDTNAGYIVTTASGTGAGTLNFGIVDPGTDYVIFAAVLDGTTVDAGTAVFGSTATTLTTLNILGNGTDKTTITGSIGATSDKSINIQDLAVQDVIVPSGTLQIGNNIVVQSEGGLTGTDSGIISLQANCLLDLSQNTDDIPITGSSIVAVAGAKVIPYGGTESEAIEAGTGNAVNKYGKCGYLVRVAAGTAANTLYDALVGGGTTYSNVIFSPALDGQTVSLVEGTTIGRVASVYGNATDKTIIAGNFNLNAQLKFYDLTFRGSVLYVSSAFYGPVVFTNCKCDGTDGVSSSLYVHMTDCEITGKTVYTAVGAESGGNIFTNCYFHDNNSTNDISTQGATITGCTFTSNRVSVHTVTTYFSDNTLNDVYVASTASFAGVNVLGGTVSGAGTIVFADGATVTSTIPSGSTIGTGAIAVVMPSGSGVNNILNADIVVENITFTGWTKAGDAAEYCFFIQTSQNSSVKDATLTNCLISGNTNMGNQFMRCFARNRRWHFNNLREDGTNGSIQIYMYGGMAYASGCDFSDSCGFSTAGGTFVLSGENKISSLHTPGANYPESRYVIVPGSTVRLKYGHDAKHTAFYVGNYTEGGNGDLLNGTIEVTGTATLIFDGGSPVTISGSGTTIDATGIHS